MEKEMSQQNPKPNAAEANGTTTREGESEDCVWAAADRAAAANWGRIHVTIEPPTQEEIEESRRLRREQLKRTHPHLFVEIDDYRDVWNRKDLKRSMFNPDSMKSHSTKTIYTIQETPLILKYVVKPAQRDALRPTLGRVVSIAHEFVTEATLEDCFTNVSRPLSNVSDAPVGIASADARQFGKIATSMGLGERCIIKRRQPAAADTPGVKIAGKDYELEVVELLHIWRRERIPPSLFIDISICSKPAFCNTDDHLFKLHYKLYKRPHALNVDFNPDHGWTLIKDTRDASAAADVVVCGHGFDFPCLERALLHLNTVGARGRILSGSSFGVNPHADSLARTYIEHDQCDLSKYNDCGQLADHDLLYLDFEVVDIQPPDYLQCDQTPLGILRSAELLKLMGNRFLQRQAYYRALKRYQKALNALLPDQKFDYLTPVEYCETVKAVLLNAALAQLKLKEWALAWEMIEPVVAMDPENVKALYRGAVCLRYLDRFEEAFRMINRAVQLEPEDKLIEQENRIIKKCLKEIESRASEGLKGLRNLPGDKEGIAEDEASHKEKNGIAENEASHKEENGEKNGKLGGFLLDCCKHV